MNFKPSTPPPSAIQISLIAALGLTAGVLAGAFVAGRLSAKLWPKTGPQEAKETG